MWNLTPSFAICTGTVQKGKHLATRGLCADRWDRHILICTCTAQQPKYILNTAVGMFSSRCRQLMENCAQLVISGNVFSCFCGMFWPSISLFVAFRMLSSIQPSGFFVFYFNNRCRLFAESLQKAASKTLGIFKGSVHGCTPWTQCFSHWWMGFKRCV